MFGLGFAPKSSSRRASTVEDAQQVGNYSKTWLVADKVVFVTYYLFEKSKHFLYYTMRRLSFRPRLIDHIKHKLIYFLPMGFWGFGVLGFKRAICY